MKKQKSGNNKDCSINPEKLIARMADSGNLINLAGNYDYLGKGYYLSMDYENAGHNIRPSCKEMIDAYVPPLFLEKAKTAGISIPGFYISNGYIEPPVIVDPINPFTLKGRVVLKSRESKSIAKSLTRNFTYAVCCQEIPEGSKIIYFHSVLGWSIQARFQKLSMIVWEHFNIPLARVRVIHTPDDKYLLSDISPLFTENLRKREIKYIEDNVIWEN